MLPILIFLIVFSPYLSVVSLIIISFITFKKNKNINNSLWDKGMLFIFFWSVIAGIVNHNFVAIGVSLVILLLYFMGVNLEKNYYNRYQIHKLLKYTLFLSVGSAFIGLLEKVTSIQYTPGWWQKLFGIYQFASKGISPRITGTFGNQNVAATWYASMVLISLYLLMNVKDNNKTVYSIVTFLFVVVLFLTGSRGGILGLFLGIIIYLYLRGERKKAYILSLLSLVGIILIFKFPNYFPRGDIFFSSLNKREYIWQKTIEMIILKPVTGWGFLGTYFYEGLNEFHGHNIILTFGSAIGMVGLTVFLIMNYNLAKELKFLKKNQCDFVPLLAGIIVLIFGQGFFDCTIMNPQAGIIYFGTAAIVNGLSYKYKQEVNHKFDYEDSSILLSNNKSMDMK